MNVGNFGNQWGRVGGGKTEKVWTTLKSDVSKKLPVSAKSRSTCATRICLSHLAPTIWNQFKFDLSSISSSHWTLQTDTRTHTYISSVKAQKQGKPPLHTKCLRAPETLLKNTYLISKPKWFCGSEWWNLILTHSITFLCFGCLFLCDLCFSQLDSQINGTILLSAC